MKNLCNSLSKKFSTNSLLKEEFRKILPEQQARLKDIKLKYGNEPLQTINVEQTLGGMRGIKGLFHDMTILDPSIGITFRGHSLPDMAKTLPKAQGGQEPLPEGLVWLLMTGNFPNQAQMQAVSQEIRERSQLSNDVVQFVKSLPKNMHPMTQLSTAVLYLQPQSQFAKAYADGVHKSKYWESSYEDAMNLIAKIPKLAAIIYRNNYFNGKIIESDDSLDLAGNYSHMMGYDSHGMKECLRGYLSIHSDHEGGNVSAHATKLVGSALADPYLSYSAGINGLAGPLHGLANQEVLLWLTKMRAALGDNPSDEAIKEYVLTTLSQGKVVPGYGHAVLRHTDPRFTHQQQFALRNIKDDPLVNLVQKVYGVVPGVLNALGKVKNPYPNVDAHSGVLLNHYGLNQYEYYTVVFAVSRAIGCALNLVWDRAFGLAIERPGSIDMAWIEKKYKK